MDEDKLKIIELFKQNVKNKKADTSNANQRHDGKEGHWLEQQMGISANADNDADLLGYEMKKGTFQKTTFGDWSADYYIFKGKEATITREEFFKYFGKPNEDKGGRISWSGEVCPKINNFNRFGQKLIVDDDLNIIAIYSYSYDTRENKDVLLPDNLKQDNLILAKWDKQSIQHKLENKFNKKGWFKIEKDKSGIYQSIHFGAPINYENWIALVKAGVVYFDSGMYETNNRPYSQWRANNTLWTSLIIDSY